MENLVGQRFGLLTVTKFGERRKYNYYWICRCDCGAEALRLSSNLKRSKRPSCNRCREPAKQHGHSCGHKGSRSGRSPTYTSWLAMFGRVKGKSEKLRYGYSHVAICERWHKFENFLADMGVRPKNRTLDRVDVMGNYEPSNCRWATWKEQIANRRQRRDHAQKPGQESIGAR